MQECTDFPFDFAVLGRLALSKIKILKLIPKSLIMKNWLQLLQMNKNEIPFLVDGLIPSGQLGMLVGPSDVGKSTLARQLAQHIAGNDSHFLSRKINYKTRRVLFITTEDDETTTAFFLNKNSVKFKDPTENLEFLFEVDNYVINYISKQSDQTPYDLIIVDNLADVFAVYGKQSLNDAMQVRSFLAMWNSICNKYGTTVIMLHHLKKGRENEAPTKNNLNGSQAIEAKSRFVLELRDDLSANDMSHLCIVKGNSISKQEKKESIELIRDSNLTFDATGNRRLLENLASIQATTQNNDQRKEVERLRSEGKSYKAIEDETGVNRGTVHRWLNAPSVAVAPHP